MATAAAADEGDSEEGMRNPRFMGSAERRPFSTASVALKTRMLMLFIMSSIKA